MTNKIRQLSRLNGLISRLEPKIARAFRDAMQRASGDISFSQLVAALENGNIGQALQLVEISPGILFELDEEIRAAYIAGGLLATEDVPRALRGKFSFNGRHLRAEEWVRENVGNLVQGIQSDTLQTTRDVILQGFQENRTPRQVARDITGRNVGGRRVGGFLGLNSDQTDQVIRARRMLSDPEQIKNYFIKDRETGRLKPRYKLSNRNMDSLVRRAIANGTALSGKDLERVIEAHKAKAMGYRGNVIAKDQTFTAIAAGREESYAQMIARDDVEDVTKRWQHNLSEFPREDHVEMNGTVLSFNEVFRFPDGATLRHPQDVNADAGHKIGCRCTAFYRVVVAKN